MASPDTGLPPKIGAPATRALTAAGYTELRQLAGVPAAELGKLHGVGPKALRLLQEALQEQGMSLGLARVSFNVSADAYLRFMGRYSEPLAAQFARLAGVRRGQRVLDVGCGPGALAAVLVSRAGADAVSAVEPSASFAAAARERLPGVDVRQSAAERLPFPGDTFDAALAQLVVHFMTDPVTGLREMARVTRPGGIVAACVWDHAGGRGPVSTFWRAARELDPAADNESGLAGVREGHLADLFAQAGLDAIQAGSLTVRVRQADFESWWEPFTLGVGPAGAYLAALDDAGRAALREQCRQRLPEGPFEVSATAWAATGQA